MARAPPPMANEGERPPRAIPGPGKYDELATLVREIAQADLVLLVIGNGVRGNGFEVQASSANALGDLPENLREMARRIELGMPAVMPS